ncbi:MAG TPA: zinc-ribbon domain-containing protein [Pyrinomonadaceae bacterium]|nr:zinc-ribbon domain-containing protein [Pyrinomonadaceae bacterium]
MVIICQQCTARLQLDDTKVPARTFTVRCPKCQHIINAQPPAAQAAGEQQGALGLSGSSSTSHSRFERPRPAPAYKLEDEGGGASADAAAPDKEDVAQLLSTLLQRAMTTAADEASKSSTHRRPFAHRRALICAGEEHRFAVARALVENGYEAYVAEDTTQAIERMREDHMDVVILDPQFDPQEKGAAFIKREVSALRPAARRRLFFVHLTPDARSGDQHAAFVHHANLTINPAEIEEMPYVLDRAIRNFNELYRDFNRAMQVAEF